MVDFKWFDGEVPKGIKVTQVYGIVFTIEGRTLIKSEYINDKKIYSMAGGKPELFDADRVATLRREFLEEVNTELCDDIYMVGYQLVNENNGKPEYAQVRMTGIIKSILKKLPDPDNGKTFDRLLTTPQRAIELLNWGESGKKQIESAYKVAHEKLGIVTTNFTDEDV